MTTTNQTTARNGATDDDRDLAHELLGLLGGDRRLIHLAVARAKGECDVS